jgi:hypothetical protein
MKGWQVNDVIEGMWKEVAVTQFKALSRHSHGETENKPWQISVRIAGLRAEIWTRHPQYQYEWGGCTRRPMHRDHFLIHCASPSALFRQ